ncbi:DUF2274 domain-containing protein [Paracoccus versutus]|uniref:DUF2274 domain-containing protein n=1 Tax=Paracoccus versutus TaxID=34007 RepID=A0AAQ0KL83_PARVE|nr:DUF2274 domain-containing protein [Paracoccus versutus]KGJ08583.1 small protein [Paracoccus versutus]REG45899.1 hypothetical protein ATH84_101866 [Paracoccus versutus]WEJ77658.1 DUF2274 domain-containing protein [Paracoccus versutus]
MTKLKLGPIVDDTPVKMAVELPAGLHRDLALYGELLGRSGMGGGQETAVPPQKLVVPMLERFLASDRGFAKAKRSVSAGRQSGD